MSLVPMLATGLTYALLGGNAAGSAQVTFSRDIAPIFQARCQECHRPGEVAPMALLSYADARPWARSIKKKVEAKEMPPWHAGPAHGKWQNDPRLKEEEIAKIGAWVENGAPEGDPAELPPPKKFVDGWRIGKPDVVFTMPQEYRVKAEGEKPKSARPEVPYKFFAIPTNFEEDKWVQAAEARPGNREVVHHIIVFIKEPKQRSLGGGGSELQHHLCGVAPGTEPDIFPIGTAKRIKAGSYLVFQVHYTPTDKDATDRSSIGIIFAREPVRQRLRADAIMSRGLRIPPGAPDHIVEASKTFSEDSVLWAVMPHMHLRGKSFRYDIIYPDGKTDTLLDVPRWDFNWQHNYFLAEPLTLPKGSRIACRAVYDNSPQNRANPDPSKEVGWGDQTWDEMMIGFITTTRKDENLAGPGEKTF